MSCKVTHCTGQVPDTEATLTLDYLLQAYKELGHSLHRMGLANTRPHQPHWGDCEMGTATSCTECSQVAGLIKKVGRSSSKAHYLTSFTTSNLIQYIVRVQWNLATTDIIGTKIFILISEASLFQGAFKRGSRLPLFVALSGNEANKST